MDAKQFALQQIAPYFIDPSTCGYENGKCVYITNDGRMCVAGKNMVNPNFGGTCPIEYLIRENQNVLKEEVRGILSTIQWEALQDLHDAIAKHDLGFAKIKCEKLDLFTYEELVQYCEQLKAKENESRN